MGRKWQRGGGKIGGEGDKVKRGDEVADTGYVPRIMDDIMGDEGSGVTGMIPICRAIPNT